MTVRDSSLPEASAAPGGWAVFIEQVKTIGLGLRREGLALGALVVVVTVIALNDVLEDGAQLDFPTDASFVLPLMALLAPFAVWKGERLFRGAHLWTLPVDRQQHALTKMLAGGVWMLAAAVGMILWLMLLAVATDGAIFGPHDRLLLTGPITDVVQPGQVKTVAWTTPAWQWASLFTGTAIAYLLSSAVVIGLRYPLRWVAGCVFLLTFLSLAWSEDLFEDLLEMLVMGPVGIDYVLSGGAEGLDVAVRLADGQRATAWRAFPTAGPWALATGFWFIVSAALVWLAAWRHRER
ncbi:MAG TPA: hypothetical protein VEA15_06645 [Caulobacteraceae bacterium]|nr:hypothetical protein [Caulobacteraceae bacterium]